MRLRARILFQSVTLASHPRRYDAYLSKVKIAICAITKKYPEPLQTLCHRSDSKKSRPPKHTQKKKAL